jgi:hypothetical protein
VSGGTAARAVDAWTWDPAGPDDLLARACADLKAGRYWLAAEALAETGDHDTRARRSALLAAHAAKGDMDVHWLKEAPANPDARLLAARTAALRVRHAPEHLRARLLPRAVELCRQAAEAAPRDPTPWVAVLMLRAVGSRRGRSLTLADAWSVFVASPAAPRLDGPWNEAIAAHLAGPPPPNPTAEQLHYRRARIHHAAQALLELPVVGPWDALFEVWARAPRSREGNLRFLDCLTVGDARMFADLMRQVAPPDSLLQTLPLTANLADYRHRLNAETSAIGRGDLAQRVWEDETLAHLALDLYEDWFTRRVRRRAPVEAAEYLLLAHALVMTGAHRPHEVRRSHHRRAAEVIETVKPYASPHPWALTAPHGNGQLAFAETADELGIKPPAPRTG